MKYIILLLLISLYCKAQHYENYVRITAFRVVDPNREGHTLITDFIEENAYVGYRLQAVQDEDEVLAFALLKLKEEAMQWEKKPLPIQNKNDTPLKVPNMYVVQINRYRDTIFTTRDNASIYFPQEEMEHIDPANYFNGLLNEKLCFFTERNFKDEFRTHRNDSIKLTAVLLNGKSVYGNTRESFNKNIERFQRVTTDSIFEGKNIAIDKHFWINNYKMTFNGKLKTLDAIFIPGARYIKEVSFSVGGIQLGDSEEKLAVAFPCSLEYRHMNATVYDLNNNYYYTVQLADDKGFALFYIKNRHVERIEIEFL